jgi:anti-anti-sigma factor
MKKNVKFRKKDSYLIVDILVTQFNLFDKTSLSREIQKNIEKFGYPDVIFNLNEVSFMDSIGIGFMISTKNIFNEKKKKMAVVTSNEKVLEVLSSIKADRFFPVFKTMEAAEADFTS